MTTSHVNLRDDVLRETKMCGVTVNVNIIELTRMFTVKKGDELDRLRAPQCCLKLRMNINGAFVGMRRWHE